MALAGGSGLSQQLLTDVCRRAAAAAKLRGLAGGMPAQVALLAGAHVQLAPAAPPAVASLLLRLGHDALARRLEPFQDLGLFQRSAIPRPPFAHAPFPAIPLPLLPC